MPKMTQAQMELLNEFGEYLCGLEPTLRCGERYANEPVQAAIDGFIDLKNNPPKEEETVPGPPAAPVTGADKEIA